MHVVDFEEEEETADRVGYERSSLLLNCLYEGFLNSITYPLDEGWKRIHRSSVRCQGNARISGVRREISILVFD